VYVIWTSLGKSAGRRELRRDRRSDLSCGRHRYGVVSVGSEMEGLGREISLRASAVAKAKISNTVAHPHISPYVLATSVASL